MGSVIVFLRDDPFFSVILIEQEFKKKVVYRSSRSSTGHDRIAAIVKQLDGPLQGFEKVGVRSQY